MQYYALYTKCVSVYVSVWCVYFRFCLYMCMCFHDLLNASSVLGFVMTLIIPFNFPEINECLSQPCMNGGTCRDRVASYLCECEDGFSGQRCQTGNTLQYLLFILNSLSYVCHIDIMILEILTAHHCVKPGLSLDFCECFDRY